MAGHNPTDLGGRGYDAAGGTSQWITLIHMSTRATRPEGPDRSAGRSPVRDVPPSFISSPPFSIPATAGQFACFDARAENLFGTTEVTQSAD